MAEIDVVPLAAADEAPPGEEAAPVKEHIAVEEAAPVGEDLSGNDDAQPCKRGRPKGKKDSQPRKPRAPRVTFAPPSEPPTEPAQVAVEAPQIDERVAERMREPDPQEAFEIAMRSVMQMAAQRQQRNEAAYTQMIQHMFR